MAKGKLLGFYREDETRRKILNYIAMAFLGLLMARAFLSFTFLTVPNLYLVLLAGGMAALVLLQLFFLLPDLNDGLFFLWLLFLLALDISYVTHFTGLEYICNTIIFLGTLTLLPHIRLKGKTLRAFISLFLVFSFLVVIFANKTMYEKTLIFMNTNTSSFICFLTVVLLIACGSKADKRMKWVLYAAAALWAVFLLPFGGRSSMIGILLFLGYFVLRKFFDKLSARAVKYILISACAFAILFAYLYAMFLFDWIGGDNIVLFGKKLFSGRQEIWRSAFDQLKGNWFFGVGHVIMSEGSTGTPNVHNQMLGYLTCFGLIPTLLYVFLLAKLTVRLNTVKKMTAAFIITLIVVSYFEILLYSTWGMTLVPLVLIFVYQLDCKEGKTQLTIHYCSIGKAKDAKWKYCLRSWKRYCPNAQFVEWDESTYNMKKNAYLTQAYEQKKYSYVVDYIRFDILHRFGGVWLDGDMEMLRNFLPLTRENFLCFGANDCVDVRRIVCADAGEPLLKEILDHYDGLESFSTEKNAADITTETLLARGLQRSEDKQKIAGFVIYPSERLHAENAYFAYYKNDTWSDVIGQVCARYQAKYGEKKGKRIFTLRHPLLAMKKRRMDNGNKHVDQRNRTRI